MAIDSNCGRFIRYFNANALTVRVCSFLPRDAMLARYLLSLSVSVCLSVRPSVTSRYCIERNGRNPAGFGTEASSHLSYTLRYDEIRVSPKIRVLPSGTLSQTPDFENFATASRSCCQNNSSTVQPASFFLFLFILVYNCGLTVRNKRICYVTLC